MANTNNTIIKIKNILLIKINSNKKKIELINQEISLLNEEVLKVELKTSRNFITNNKYKKEYIDTLEKYNLLIDNKTKELNKVTTENIRYKCMYDKFDTNSLNGIIKNIPMFIKNIILLDILDMNEVEVVIGMILYNNGTYYRTHPEEFDNLLSTNDKKRINQEKSCIILADFFNSNGTLRRNNYPELLSNELHYLLDFSDIEKKGIVLTKEIPNYYRIIVCMTNELKMININEYYKENNITKDTLEEYYQNGKIIKPCNDLIKFKSMLEEYSLSIQEKMSIQNLMAEYMTSLKREVLNKSIDYKMTEEEELIYKKALHFESRKDIKDIINEIDNNIDLLNTTDDYKDREYLLLELNELFTLLVKKLNIKISKQIKLIKKN